MTAPIAIIMGSQSDWETMRHAAETLDRTRRRLRHTHRLRPSHPGPAVCLRQGAKAAGFKVIIAGAGGAAHLPGMAASLTALPVFGVPVESKALSGVDSLYSIVQMPAGIPVGTLAIGKAGAINAALLAASVLALNDPALRPPRRMAQATDRGGRRTPGGIGVTAANRGEAAAGRHHRNPRRRTAGANARDGRGAARPQGRGIPARPGLAGLRSGANRDLRRLSEDEALQMFAKDVDVVTYEFENVPAATAVVLAARSPCGRRTRAVETRRTASIEKEFVDRLGIGTAAYADVSTTNSLLAGNRANGPSRRDQDPPLRL